MHTSILRVGFVAAVDRQFPLYSTTAGQALAGRPELLITNYCCFEVQVSAFKYVMRSSQVNDNSLLMRSGNISSKQNNSYRDALAIFAAWRIKQALESVRKQF